VTCPTIMAQSFQITHYPCSQRIQMNISRQFKQIRVIFTNDGFIPVLKEMTIPLMPQVKIDHIPRKKFPHTLGNRLPTRPNQ